MGASSLTSMLFAIGMTPDCITLINGDGKIPKKM